jgi:hypothetical protein
MPATHAGKHLTPTIKGNHIINPHSNPQTQNQTRRCNIKSKTYSFSNTPMQATHAGKLSKPSQVQRIKHKSSNSYHKRTPNQITQDRQHPVKNPKFITHGHRSIVTQMQISHHK